MKKQEVVLRWLKFNFVGAIGIGVQLIVLTALKSGFHLDYLVATALAVEAAVVHNYLWHERFTWADHLNSSALTNMIGGATGVPARLVQFVKFNLTTGLFSILGNLLLMKILVGYCGMSYLPANLLTIATCSLVNFLASDRFVFQNQSPTEPKSESHVSQKRRDVGHPDREIGPSSGTRLFSPIPTASSRR